MPLAETSLSKRLWEFQGATLRSWANRMHNRWPEGNPGRHDSDPVVLATAFVYGCTAEWLVRDRKGVASRTWVCSLVLNAKAS